MRKRGAERKTPTQATLIKALVDKQTFATLIEFHGGWEKFGVCHAEMMEWVDSDIREHKRNLALIPRGHLKTTVLTVLDILHSLYINPNLRIYIGSAGFGLSKAILREIMANFSDRWLQDNVWNNRPHISGRLVPVLDSYGRIQRKREKTQAGGDVELEELDEDKKVIWRADLGIQLLRPDKLKEPTICIGSAESPQTGFHYDRLYLDDIINFQNYDKPEKIERLDIWRDDLFNVLDDSYFDEELYSALCSCTRNAKYREVFRNYCNVGGDVLVVGTRYFRHDWYKKLIDAEDENTEDFRTYVRNIYKNGDNPSDGYLWHERWTEKIDQQRRRTTSVKNFNAQYLNRIVVSAEQVIPWSTTTTLNPAGMIRREGTLKVLYETAKEKLDITPYCVVDPAATYNPTSDYTAIVIGGKDKHGNLYVFDLWCGKEASTKWIKRCLDMCKKWNIRRVTLETVGFAKELKNTFKMVMEDSYPVAVVDYSPKGKSGKKERIENGLQPLMMNSKLYVMPWMSKLEYVTEQFDFFPSETVKDDVPDAIQILNEICKAPASHFSNSNEHLNINKTYGGIC